MKNRVANKKTWFAAGLLLVSAPVAAFVIWNKDSPAPPPVGGGTTTETKVEGEAVCLPHKDTSGPQTLECAFGVKLDSGTYYALRDADETYRNVGGLQTGKRYQFTGSLKTESSDRYQSIGTFTVESAEIID